MIKHGRKSIVRGYYYEKAYEKNKKAAIACGVALTAIGILAIPPIIKKYSGKMMKKSGETKDIDFDNLGPEIVKKEDSSEEE